MLITADGRRCRRFYTIPEDPEAPLVFEITDLWLRRLKGTSRGAIRDLLEDFRARRVFSPTPCDKVFVLGAYGRWELDAIREVSDIDRFVVGEIVVGPRGGVVFKKKGATT